MGNYEQLIAAIEQVIKTNGNNEITGALLQNTLKSIVNSIGANAAFAGIATPETNPGTPDQNVFYIASENGEYINFGVTVSSAPSVLTYSKGAWRASPIMLNAYDIYVVTAANVFIERRVGTDGYYHFNVALPAGDYYILYWKAGRRKVITLSENKVLDVSRGFALYYDLENEEFVVDKQSPVRANSVPLLWNTVGTTGGPFYDIYLNQKYATTRDSVLHDIVKELYILNPEDLPEDAKYFDIRVNQSGYFDTRITNGNENNLNLYAKTQTTQNPKTIDVGSPYLHQSNVNYICVIDWDAAKEYCENNGDIYRIVLPISEWATRAANNPVSALHSTGENVTVISVSSASDLKTQLDRIATSVANNTANALNRYRIELAAGVYELYNIINKSNITGQPYQRGIELPSYVDLKGIGSVTLKLTVPDGAPESHSEYLSTLNIYGENTIENINFEVTNGRYCLHDDSAEVRNTNLVVRNCSFVHHANTIVPDQYACHCYGAGYSVGRKAIFENCIFKQEIPDGNVFLIHDHPTQGANAISYEAEIKNCYFEKGASETSANVACAICLSNAYGGITANPANISISGCIVKGGIYTYSRHEYTGGYNIFGGGNEISGVINDLNANIYLTNAPES